ncbi:MAG: hypothetical protein ACXWWE_05480, partial [Nitrospira sp.]
HTFYREQTVTSTGRAAEKRGSARRVGASTSPAVGPDLPSVGFLKSSHSEAENPKSNKTLDLISMISLALNTLDEDSPRIVTNSPL